VRLKDAYYVTCVGVVKDEQTGEPVELHCTYDPATRGGSSADGRVVRGTLHWVSAAHSLPAEVRLYDHLFLSADPGAEEAGADFTQGLNPNSLEVLTQCRVEASLAGAAAGSRYQFLRQGYFCVDPDSSAEQLVFNRTVPLRDSWARAERGQQSSRARA
jgi:glutaminyl-tRNA synthetase